MNRAFAAEFLVPHEMLKRELSGAMIGEDEIDDLAVEYGVSTFVIRHQIENHQLAQIAL
jgi:Zn-dependent peptidase ImmA (M78 family)